MENKLQRKKSITRFITLLKNELKKSNETNKYSLENDESIYDMDVVMLKGVGP